MNKLNLLKADIESDEFKKLVEQNKLKESEVEYLGNRLRSKIVEIEQLKCQVESLEAGSFH